MPAIHSVARARRRAAAPVALLLCLTLAACGSQLRPEDVALTNGNGAGTVGGTSAGTGGDSGLSAGGTGGGAGTTTGGGAGTTSGGGAAAGGGTSTSGGGSGGGDPAAPPESKQNCDGFENGPGITNDTITIGNSSDISGPVPGLFEQAQAATKAFVAYFNATSTICGRKLVLKSYDSRTDAAADQQAYSAACDEVFAMVGSMSAFDSGGAATAEQCGLPDIRSASVTNERNGCSVCFGAQSANPAEFENAVPDFVLENYPAEVASHAAFLYIDAGASAQNATQQVKAMTKRGLDFVYTQGISTTEFNYGPYVQKLKQAGARVVFWTGAWQQSVRLRQAMTSQDYQPDLYLRDPTDYNSGFVSQGGSDVDGTVIFTNFTPFEEAGSQPETALYVSWLKQTDPNAEPGFFGAFAWSAARLFVTNAIKLGGGLDRAALIDSFAKTDNWTANGLTAPQHIGPKRVGDCWRFIQLDNGVWKPVDGTKYHCNGTTQAD